MPDIRVAIDKLAFGGSGVGRIDGKVCFVPFSCPGDELLVRIVAEKRSYLTAAIVEVTVPSPDRTSPPCPLFGRCGGCDWQNVAYGRQLEAKRQILAETLWRGARVESELVAPTVASPEQYGYRSRVQFKLFGYAEQLQIGFYRAGSHFVEDIPEGCPIAVPKVNQALHKLREVLASFPEPTLIPQINIDCADEGAVAIVNYIGSNRDAVLKFFQAHCRELDPLTAIFLQSGRKSTMEKIYGDETLAYSMPGSSNGLDSLLKFRPGGFSQVNLPQNRAILKIIREMARFDGKEAVLDLYCGNGNFSLPIARNVKSVTGIEDYGDSITAAIANAALNGIGNAEFHCVDAVAGTRLMQEQGRRFDLVLLDPPRAGGAEVVPEIIRLNPPKIIYVSCDPNTLARDCGRLAAGGYKVLATVPVDMFPHTYHLESVTLLEKQNS